MVRKICDNSIGLIIDKMVVKMVNSRRFCAVNGFCAET